MFTSHTSQPPLAITWVPAHATQELPLGAHLVTPRRHYTHHGIYVGEGHVIHYAGFARSWQAGPVEEWTLVEFTSAQPLGLIDHPQSRHSAQQIVQRARARLGEQNYHLLRNNCEHFCNECIDGLHHSVQVQSLGRLSSLALTCAVGLRSAAQRRPRQTHASIRQLVVAG
jgi:Lecithin retinol acyltransferase